MKLRFHFPYNFWRELRVFKNTKALHTFYHKAYKEPQLIPNLTNFQMSNY